MTAQLEALRCLVCGRCGGHRPTLAGTIWNCPSCTFSWTAADLPPPTELYGESYFKGEGYEDYFLPRPRRYESARRLRWLTTHTRPTTLIEAGSAGGYFLEAARNAGITAHGVEVSETAAQFARDQLGVPVTTGRFETLRPPHPVDTICAFHVLEHVEDPRHFLHTAHHMLTPDGHLAIEVPNIASAAAHRLGTSWPHLQLRYHRWHFTPRSLARLVEACGFEVVAADTIFSRFYWRPLGRFRRVRGLLIADLAASGSLRVRHPRLGDALRLVARRSGGRHR